MASYKLYKHVCIVSSVLQQKLKKIFDIIESKLNIIFNETLT